MSESPKVYVISKDLSDKILEFLENPFDTTKECTEMLKSINSFTEEEINQIISLLGKFPAYLVYPIIDSFKGNLKVEEIEQQQ